jgi:hypothetical protein
VGPILAPLTGPLLVSVSVMVLASFEYMNVFMHTRRGPLRLAGRGWGGGENGRAQEEDGKRFLKGTCKILRHGRRRACGRSTRRATLRVRTSHRFC